MPKTVAARFAVTNEKIGINPSEVGSWTEIQMNQKIKIVVALISNAENFTNRLRFIAIAIPAIAKTLKLEESSDAFVPNISGDEFSIWR